jgi:hypothetical protein
LIFDFLLDILNWSEVWALLIPLAVLLIRRRQPRYVKPVILYLVIALVLDLFIDIGYIYKLKSPGWMYPNNYMYNIHSIVRLVCFGLFFSYLKQSHFRRLNTILPIVALVSIIINFLFFEDFYIRDQFSSFLFTVESGLLLFYCLQYYLSKMQEDDVSKRGTDYWIVTGIAIYVVFNFFYFLFYTTLLPNYRTFVINMWHVHNVTFIILCIFIAKGFYASPRQ